MAIVWKFRYFNTNETQLARKIESTNINVVEELEHILKKYDFGYTPEEDYNISGDGTDIAFLKFHKQHYLILIVKWIIINIYGRKPGYFNHQLSAKRIENKEKYCREYLSVLDIIDAGISHNRGII